LAKVKTQGAEAPRKLGEAFTNVARRESSAKDIEVSKNAKDRM